MTDTANPFKGRRDQSKPAPTNLLYRFTKPGGHCAEIRERKVAMFGGLEYLVFVDGSFLESQLFHGARLPAFPEALEARI